MRKASKFNLPGDLVSEMKASYPSLIKLVPTTPGRQDKYGASLDRREINPKAKTTIPRLTHFTGCLDGVPLPQPWVEYVHPEGNVYYYSPSVRLLTNADPRRSGLTALFEVALEQISERLHVDSKPKDYEIYFDHPESLASSSAAIIRYYVVNYDHKSIFWVEPVDVLTDLPGLDAFESLKQLQLVLRPEFWTHVEQYPCHQPTYDHDAEKELIAIFRYGYADDSTAPGSNFPYGAKESRGFLKLLERTPSDELNYSHRRSWTARLWTSISRSRHINRFGLSHARLDRLQGLDSYLLQQTRRSLVLTIGEALCLGMSKETFNQLTELWNGRIVYQRHWQPFLEERRSEWRWTVFGALYTVVIDVTHGISGTSFVLVVASLSFCCSSIVLSTLLLLSHSSQRLYTASDISQYISKAESLSHGLRPLSIVFTLPKVLAGYGVLVTLWSIAQQCASHLRNYPSEMVPTTLVAAMPMFIGLLVYKAYGPV